MFMVRAVILNLNASFADLSGTRASGPAKSHARKRVDHRALGSRATVILLTSASIFDLDLALAEFRTLQTLSYSSEEG